MVKKLAIIREIFKGDHNVAAVRKLRRNQISALSGPLGLALLLSTLMYITYGLHYKGKYDICKFSLHVTRG